MFSCMSCGQNDFVMEKHAPFKDDVKGYKATICGGRVAMAPVQCLACCGYGPLAAQWRFKEDKTYEGDGTRYVGIGSAFAGECCLMCTNHNGDAFMLNTKPTRVRACVEVTTSRYE